MKGVIFSFESRAIYGLFESKQNFIKKRWEKQVNTVIVDGIKSQSWFQQQKSTRQKHVFFYLMFCNTVSTSIELHALSIILPFQLINSIRNRDRSVALNSLDITSTRKKHNEIGDFHILSIFV